MFNFNIQENTKGSFYNISSSSSTSSSTGNASSSGHNPLYTPVNTPTEILNGLKLESPTKKIPSPVKNLESPTKIKQQVNKQMLSYIEEEDEEIKWLTQKVGLKNITNTNSSSSMMMTDSEMNVSQNSYSTTSSQPVEKNSSNEEFVALKGPKRKLEFSSENEHNNKRRAIEDQHGKPVNFQPIQVDTDFQFNGTFKIPAKRQ